MSVIVERANKKIVKVAGKTYQLPVVFHFSKTDSCFRIPADAHFYDVVDFREPKAGEWFVSGAIPSVYHAKNDLNTKYIVVVPTNKAKKQTVTQWVKP